MKSPRATETSGVVGSRESVRDDGERKTTLRGQAGVARRQNWSLTPKLNIAPSVPEAVTRVGGTR